MEGIELPEIARQWINDILVWIGFGTIVGLLAKAIMPGRDPGGALATVLTGVAGSIIGCAILSYFWVGVRVTPIGLMGFLVATGGAFVLLFFYRLLAGRIVREGAAPLGLVRRRGRQAVVVETRR